MIKDSGNRTEFATGAVRDIQSGKGRCDLMPLEAVADLLQSEEIKSIAEFQRYGDTSCLIDSLRAFWTNSDFDSLEVMILEVAKHFEEGALKYGENNWQKGIPVHSYIDSAIRHLLKYKANITDEPHNRAFCWNLLCAAWTMQNKPELDDFTCRKGETNNASN